MKNLFKRLSTFAGDYSGVCNAAHHMNCLTVLHGHGGCIGGVSTCDDFELDEHDMKIFFTKISEVDAVTGNDNKIIDMIVQAGKDIPCDFILLCGSPIPMLIGTDYRAWKRLIEKRIDLPVIALDTKGFDRYDKGEEALFHALIDTFTLDSQKKRNRVNVIGDTALNGWNSEMRESFRETLSQEYEEVLFWSKDVQMEEISTASEATLNIAVSVSAVSVVKKLYERYGTAYRIGMDSYGWAEKQIDDKQPRYRKNDSEKKILLVGEQVMMNALRSCLRKDFGVLNVSVATFFQLDKEIAEDGDHELYGEDDYERILAVEGEYDVIIGDPELRVFGGYHTFVDLPQIAVSGRVISDSIPNLYGKYGYEFLKKGLKQ